MTQTARSRLPFRLPTTRPALAVIAGDLFVLFAFIAVGQYTHQYFFWEVPVRTVLVVTPFAIGWALAFSLAGLFGERTIGSYRRTLAFVVPSWIGVSLIGSALRGTELFPGGSPPVFVLVNVGIGLLFFLPWRLFATWLYRRSVV